MTSFGDLQHQETTEKLGTSHDIKALPLAHFSMVVLKEQIIISIRKKRLKALGQIIAK